MRILVVTNLYPPYYHGGYEIRCAQVAEALRVAGHEVWVLTSAYGVPLRPFGRVQPPAEQRNGVAVHRWLNQYAYEPQPAHRPWTFFQAKRELSDARVFRKILARFRPDIVNWWSMYGLSKTLLPIPESQGIPDVHWIEHWWMIEEYGRNGEKAVEFWVALWEGRWGPRIWRPLLGLAGRGWERCVRRQGMPTRVFPNRPRHVCFVSEYMRTLHREAGLEFPSSEIIYGGVPAGRFYVPIVAERHASARLRVLYAGQISRDRGLHTVVDAIGLLEPSVRSRVSLSIAGSGPAAYVEWVRERINTLGLTGCVSFLGKVPHDDMPRIYKEHEVLVFPSTRAEGLPLTMVEAMLSGCAVLTTGSGGAREIAALADLPLFPKDDPATLSQLLGWLVGDRCPLGEIAARAQAVALREFTAERMMEQWIATLERLLQSPPPSRRLGRHRKREIGK